MLQNIEVLFKELAICGYHVVYPGSQWEDTVGTSLGAEAEVPRNFHSYEAPDHCLVG